MILCAGLTPAWQQIMVFDRLRIDEVNRASQVAWCASGKVLNAGIAARHMGADCVTLSPVGGLPREPIQREMELLGVAFQPVATESPTRVCTTLLDQASGHVTELVENAVGLNQDELDRYAEAFAKAAKRASVVVLIGSLPVGTPSAYYDRLAEQVECPLICDFRGEGLKGMLHREPYVVKPNREELAATVGYELPDDNDVIRAALTLNEAGARWAVITDRDRPLIATSACDGVYRVTVPAVSRDDVANPIGCGDAMAGAMAWCVEQGHDIETSLRFGVAAAIDNLRSILPCRLDAERIRAEQGQIQVERLD